MSALYGAQVHCRTIKSNVGHLEATAAVAGLASLISLPSTNVQLCALRYLNSHLGSLELDLFCFPADVVPLGRPTMSRLSSFGYSGTIAHGVFSMSEMRCLSAC